MPKIQLKKANKSTVDKWHAVKRQFGLTDKLIADNVDLTRRRVSMALNRHEVNPNDIEKLNNFFNTLCRKTNRKFNRRNSGKRQGNKKA